jgi:hypothetical protein
MRLIYELLFPNSCPKNLGAAYTHANTVILYVTGCYVQNGVKRTGESFLRAGIRQDNVSVKCATTFSDTLWKESASQEVYLRLAQVWEALDNRFDICLVTRGAHIECL